MAFDAITGISNAEALAKARVAEAEAKAKQMLQDAEASGKAALEAAGTRADSELRVLREKAQAQTEDKVQALNASEIAAVLSAAEARLDEAAALITERIMGG